MVEQAVQFGQPGKGDRDGRNDEDGAAAAYAASDSHTLLGRPASRRTRMTVVGPPAASAPDGVCAGGARDQGTGQGSGSRGAHGGVVGEHLDEQPDRSQRAAAADEPGEGGVDGDERLEHQVVAGAQMGALVAQDRRRASVSLSADSVPSLSTTRLRTPGRQ